MRDNIKAFATIISRTLPLREPIYEFGSFQVPEQMEYADLRPLFPNKTYVGCDMREGPGVDKILDLHTIDVPSDSVGTVLCFDTLEHVEYPRKALEEIHRILMPNGTVVISSVMDFPIHDYPNDYWRFTPEAFKSLLKPFSDAFVGFQGKNSFPHTVVGIGFKGDTPPLMEFKEQYQDWQRAERRSITRLALDITPPILVPAISYFYRVATRLKRRTTEYPRN